MIVDSSALVAIIFREPNFEQFLAALSTAPSTGIGAPTAVETGIGVGRRLGFARPWVIHQKFSSVRPRSVRGVKRPVSRTEFLAVIGALGGTALLPNALLARSTGVNILLVHGAFTDGDVWYRVIPILQRAGHKVIAAQNSLASLASDVANTRAILARLSGPTILVGHSYGGSIISGAARDAKNVVGLVYVAAIAPDNGESFGELLSRFPKMPSSNDFEIEKPGYLILNRNRFPADFAADIDPTEARILASVQKPMALGLATEKSGPPAWKQFPSWYAVSANDRAIQPDAERFFAARIKATTITVAASHLSMVSHPREIAKLIIHAAQRRKL